MSYNEILSRYSDIPQNDIILFFYVARTGTVHVQYESSISLVFFK